MGICLFLKSHFELYKTKISHGTDKSKIATDIIGIKCAADKVHLLKEYFSQLASPESYEKQIGVFVLTGAVHLLGAVNYAKLLCRDHNASTFLQNVVTIPIGDLQHVTHNIPFSLHNDTDIDKTTLDDLICDQPWCYSIEHTNIPTKILLVTNKTNLEQACKWVENIMMVQRNHPGVQMLAREVLDFRLCWFSCDAWGQ